MKIGIIERCERWNDDESLMMYTIEINRPNALIHFNNLPLEFKYYDEDYRDRMYAKLKRKLEAFDVEFESIN